MSLPEQPQPTDRLALLYQLTQAFNSTLDLDEVLNRVMDEVIAATGAERGFVMLQEPERGLVFRVARGIDQTTIEDPQFEISRSVVERVASEGKPVLTSDAQLDERFNIRQSVLSLRLRSILCIPLVFKEKVTGVIYVDNRLQAGIFTQSDLELLNAIASSAAIAIENARLYQVAVEKGRIERELQMARRVQSSLLPSTTPKVAGWEFATLWKPAREVGGDYYDFIHCRNGQIGVVIGDVTDKGMPAALFMASTRSIFRASIYNASTAAEGVSVSNRLVCDESSDALFVTLFFVRFDPLTGEGTYVNAGHNPPLLCYHLANTDQDEVAPLERTGIPIGVNRSSAYEQRNLHLNPGDFLVLYTDGVTEANNPLGEMLGIERLQKIVFHNRKKAAQQIVVGLVNAINEFIGDAPPFDDITVVVVKRI
jgi:serine phosphatase RsbU (regulator of sigma subunit)